MTTKEFKIQYALGTLSYSMKIDLAKNPNTPTEVLVKLSKDKNNAVRHNVAYNPNTPKEVLTILSKDENWYVRFNIAFNSNTPKKVLNKLLLDKNRHVVNGATRTTAMTSY